MSRVIGTTNSEGFTAEIWEDEADGKVHFRGDMDIDCDGGTNPHHDPYWQPDTTLHHNGKPINSDEVPGIVVPPAVVRGVKGIVMGCLAKVTNTRNGRVADAVVFDLGPRTKVGEGSPALARLLGINDHPNTGGEDSPVIIYELWPGKPATIEGITYNLQPS